MEGTSKARIVAYLFDDLEVDCAALRVQKGGLPRKITPRAFDVLVYLLEHRGRIVEKQELFDELWKERYVTDNALSRVIKEVRQVIGDDADAPRYIETIPKRGYRFIAAVTNVDATTHPQGELTASSEIVAGESGDYFTAQKPGGANAGSSLNKIKLLAAIIVGLAAVVVLIIWRIQTRTGVAERPVVVRNVQLTTWPSLDLFPAISPDGNAVAYGSDHNGSFEIYVRPLTPGAREIQITSDGRQNFEPAWSPDGKVIAYYSKNRGGIWAVPASGGDAKQLTEFGSCPAWSPDGSSIVFQSVGLTDLSAMSVGPVSPSTLWIIRAHGGDPVPITQPGNPPGGHGSPSWAPDGSRIVFISYDGSESAMWTVSLKKNELKRVTSNRGWAYNPIYAPDGEHIYYGGVSDSGSFVLCELRVSPSGGEAIGEPVEVANTGLVRIKNLSISADGKNIAYSAPTIMANIVSLPLTTNSSGVARAPITLTESTSYRKGLPSFSPDGKRIAYTEFRGGTNQDIWVMDSDGRNQVQLTNDPAIDWGPSWFPDNNRIAFQSDRQGKWAIWSVSINSRREDLVIDPGQLISWPRISPDGNQIAFNSTGSGTINVWVIPVEGGEAKQLTFDREGIGWPTWSPDGKIIAVEAKRGEDAHLMIMAADGGPLTQLTFDRGQSWPHSWSPDGDKIAFAGQRNDIWNVYWVSRTTKEQKQITNYTKLNTYVRYPAWSTHGNQIVYEYGETTGNIWLMELK